jgi:hypothetical protein
MGRGGESAEHTITRLSDILPRQYIVVDPYPLRNDDRGLCHLYRLYLLQYPGWPKFIWNLGVDFEPRTGHLFNLHYRGWTENPINSERQPNEYDYTSDTSLVERGMGDRCSYQCW